MAIQVHSVYIIIFPEFNLEVLKDYDKNVVTLRNLLFFPEKTVYFEITL